MYTIDDAEFARMVTHAIELLPKRYKDHLDNVAFFAEHQPTAEQLKKLQLRDCDMLLGLYEGIPLTQRGAGYNLVLPDKISIFQDAIQAVSLDHNGLWNQVRRTVWHEVAHYYGLDHDRIYALERKAYTSG